MKSSFSIILSPTVVINNKMSESIKVSLRTSSLNFVIDILAQSIPECQTKQFGNLQS